MPRKLLPERGVAALPLPQPDAVIRVLTYNALGAFARFVERVESCHPSEARLAAELAFTASNFILWQRLAVNDRAEEVQFYGSTPANLFTLQKELRRVGALAQGKAHGHATNERLAHVGPRDSVTVDGEADFWRGMAEHFLKGGAL